MRDIYRTALELTGQIWKPPTPVRALTVTALYVTEEGDSFEQMDLLGGAKRRQDRRQEQLEEAVDAIRRKYGRSAIAFGDGEEENPIRKNSGSRGSGSCAYRDSPGGHRVR